MLFPLHKKEFFYFVFLRPILFSYAQYVNIPFVVRKRGFSKTRKEFRMSVNIYKNRVFKVEDVVDVCVNGKDVKIENGSFSSERKGGNLAGKKRDEQLMSTEKHENVVEKEEKEKKNDGGVLWKYTTEELQSVYFFFLINLLRFKHCINVPLLESICHAINNVRTSGMDLGVHYYDENVCFDDNSSFVSVNLKTFLAQNLQNSKQDKSCSLRIYDSSLSINVEKCGILLLYMYKIFSCCKFVTCSLFHLLEMFQINCNILFDNEFNNNFNNSNISSINNVIANIKLLTHDSKIAKDKKRSEMFAADVFSFVHFQSKISDECEYFFRIMNSNFKNSLNENIRSDKGSVAFPVSSYLNVLSKNVSEHLKVLVQSILSVVNKVVPFHLEEFQKFIKKKETVQWDPAANLRKPPVLGIFTEDTNGGSSLQNNNNTEGGNQVNEVREEGDSHLIGGLRTQYLAELEDIKSRLSKIDSMKAIQQVKELADLFNELVVFVTDISILTNIIYDIECYNAAVNKYKNKKKVPSSEYNIGMGSQDFKRFVYSFIEKECDNKQEHTGYNESSSGNRVMKENECVVPNGSTSVETEEAFVKNSLLVTTALLPFLKKKLKPYKYLQEVNEILAGKNVNFMFKTPKGTKDHNGEEMQLRNIFFDFIKKQFFLNGAVEIDTPIFELKETLTNKYGEDSQLIYDLKDQGGENLSLRYDLTVPLCRFFNTNNLNQIKRFHIGKVYRRDEPNMNKGRYREFYQCDFDIVGRYDKIKTDFHVLIMFTHILKCLKKTIGNFVCKVNHRKVLEYILMSSNVSKEKLKTVSSSIDKLDKISFEQFREELINVKGIAEDSVDKIENYIKTSKSLATPYDVLSFLQKDITDGNKLEDLYKKEVFDVLDHMKRIFDLLNSYQILEQFSFDLSLARGLDYYTGIIFEFVLLSENNVGSIAAGGRYDELMKNNRGECIPAVGASIGIERIITIATDVLKQKQEQINLNKEDTVDGDIKTNKSGNEKEKIHIKDNMVDVLVCTIGDNYFNDAVSVCKQLWKNNIGAEFMYTENPKLPKQIVYALEKQIPLIIIIGDEIKEGNLKIKDLTKEKNRSDNEKEIKVVDCVQEVKTYLKEHISWRNKMEQLLFEPYEQNFQI